MLKHEFENIQTHSDLENRLRNWVSFGNPDEYDYNGIFHLLGACLDNIRKHCLEAEIEVIALSLSDVQIDTLVKLAQAAQRPQIEDD